LIARLGCVKSDWSDEILISAANMQTYRVIYEAETWLRRITLTSLYGNCSANPGCPGSPEATIKVSA
jgi:hypothetical protein